MTKKQSVILMNILAVLIGYINKFSLSYRLIHGLVGYESVWECVCKEMGLFLDKAPDIDNQRNMLTAYHMCAWLDQMLTYEDVSVDKLSIYALLPLRAFSYVAIDSLNDNYEETGICINPKLPIFKAAMLLDDGTERE